MCTYAGELPVRKGAFGYLSRGGCFPGDGNGEPPGAADERSGTVHIVAAFAAGPGVGLLFAVLLPLLAMLMLLPFTAYAAVKALSEGSQACLNCHAAPGMSMTLGDGTTVPVHVDGQRFSSSVHASLGCAGCHADVSLDNHPSATYATKRQLLEHLASACRTCHADAQLMAKPLHQRVITRAVILFLNLSWLFLLFSLLTKKRRKRRKLLFREARKPRSSFLSALLP